MIATLGAIRVGAITLGLAAAAPIETNPFTKVGNFVRLDNHHPAVGFKPKHPLPPSTANTKNFKRGQALPSNDHPMDISVDALASVDDTTKLENFLGRPLERNLLKLPFRYEHAPPPWPGSYWPNYNDSINYRWHPKDISPAEKYATVFGLDVTLFMNSISHSDGILFERKHGAKNCTLNAQCSGEDEACAKRFNESTGVCTPTWYGMCHAWAPASILEPEPKCPVTLDGVTFHVVDIKALLTKFYDEAEIDTVFTGVRSTAASEARDRYGRYVDEATRDIGPGFFHLAITNVMGLANQMVIIDIEAGMPVWNQPVASYRVMSADVLAPAEAARQFFNTDAYIFNPKAGFVVYVETKLRYVVESNENVPLVATGRATRYMKSKLYTYLLELDVYGNILGGEWVRTSMGNHPDFLWFPAHVPKPNASTASGLTYANVKRLLHASLEGTC
jgi:hypothetical protein